MDTEILVFLKKRLKVISFFQNTFHDLYDDKWGGAYGAGWKRSQESQDYVRLVVELQKHNLLTKLN